MDEIKTAVIKLTGWNPRKTFDPDELNELKASIEEYGILEPLIVRPLNGFFELVAGERRYRAACELKLETVPVVIKELTDSQVHEIMLIENLQRSQLHPLEEAQSLEVLLLEDITQEQLAKKLGKSQSWVANRLRLLQAPDRLKDMLISREITPKHVLVLLPFVEYPVLDAILSRFDEGDNKSVSVLESDVINAIIYDYDAKYVFELESPPLEYRDYDIDMSKCDDCPDIYDRSDEDYKHRYCLNRDCWQEMVKLAVDAAKVETPKVTIGDQIDTDPMEHGSYAFLERSRFDVADCKGCGSCKPDIDGDDVCLDMKCHKKKSSVYDKEQKEIELNERECVKDAVTKWSAGKAVLLGDDMRLVLSALLRNSYNIDESAVFEPWCESKDLDDDEILRLVPDTDLGIAIMRLVVYNKLHPSWHQKDSLKENFPDVAKFLDQTSITDSFSEGVEA